MKDQHLEAIPYRQCMQLPAYGCMPRFERHIDTHKKSTAYWRLCFKYSKGLYFDDDGQNHRPSLGLTVYEFADMILQGLLDQIPLGGSGFSQILH